MNRREFLKRAVVHSSVFGIIVSFFHELQIAKPFWIDFGFQEKGLLRPPGALSENEFLSKCIRCTRCQDVCESGAIQLFDFYSGKWSGTPYIIPKSTACNLCLECGSACPTGALQIVDDMTAVHMGIAEVNKDLCVSYNNTGICGACYTICPLKGKAISQGLRNQPAVHTDHCVGCGLCEEVCIVKGSQKAIRVLSTRHWSSYEKKSA